MPIAISDQSITVADHGHSSTGENRSIRQDEPALDGCRYCGKQEQDDGD
jgi:hypothetical protein